MSMFSTRNFQVDRGIRGFVLDSQGQAVKDAIVHVVGINKNVTSWIFGDYWRMLLPGTYSVMAVKDK